MTDQERAAEDARLADLHRQLEGDINDLRHLTFVCHTLAEDMMKFMAPDPSYPALTHWGGPPALPGRQQKFDVFGSVHRRISLREQPSTREDFQRWTSLRV